MNLIWLLEIRILKKFDKLLKKFVMYTNFDFWSAKNVIRTFAYSLKHLRAKQAIFKNLF